MLGVKGSQVQILSARLGERTAQLAFFISPSMLPDLHDTNLCPNARTVCEVVVDRARPASRWGSAAVGHPVEVIPREYDLDQVFLSVIHLIVDTRSRP
jgi:hypothetical protein